MLKIGRLQMENQKEKKVYTMDDVRRLDPGYKGKLENFDQKKAGRKVCSIKSTGTCFT